MSKDKAEPGNAEGREVFSQMKQPRRASTRRKRVSGGLNEARGPVVDADGGDFQAKGRGGPRARGTAPGWVQ